MTDDAVVASASALVRAQRWIALAVRGPEGDVAIAYLPFATTAHGVAVASSTLASHGVYLASAERVSLLFVDEGGAEAEGDPYARARLTVEAAVVRPEPASDAARALWDALERRLGSTVGVLRTLGDFRPFALRPIRGRLVRGFASAHDLDAGILRAVLGRANDDATLA